MVFFSILWGLCGDIDETNKKNLDTFLKYLIFEYKILDKNKNLVFTLGGHYD